jgi:hypothetical protein
MNKWTDFCRACACCQHRFPDLLGWYESFSYRWRRNGGRSCEFPQARSATTSRFLHQIGDYTTWMTSTWVIPISEWIPRDYWMIYSPGFLKDILLQVLCFATWEHSLNNNARVSVSNSLQCRPFSLGLSLPYDIGWPICERLATVNAYVIILP